MSFEDIKDRFSYHAPNAHKVKGHEAVRADGLMIASGWDQALPDCREKSLAITKLEEAVFWANAAIARN